MTTVSYHRDGYGPGRPAVDVKVRAPGTAFWPDEFDVLVRSGSYRLDVDALIEGATEDVYAVFWEQAADKAADLGLGPIEQEGRSGGWLILTDGRDPDTMAQVSPGEDRAVITALNGKRSAWLAAYAALVAWCDGEVAAAPSRVAALAQQYGMDRLGYPAARRYGLRERSA